jgi:hypothetical protein
MDTVLPQSRVEKNKNKHLHDMVQKYSSGEISREQYIRTSELKTKQERNDLSRRKTFERIDRTKERNKTDL